MENCHEFVDVSPQGAPKTKMEILEMKEGNTNPSSKPKRESQKIFWCFTLNNPEDGDLEMLLLASEKYVYQLEVGESKTPHYQGFVKLKKKARLANMKALLPKAHFESCKGSALDNYAYCTKRKGCIGGPWVKGYRKPVVDPLFGKEFRPFQKTVIDIVNSEPDDRTINWFWDYTGSIGKSTIAKHLCVNRPDEVLYIGGKAADMKYAISKFLENIENDLKVVLIDIPRTAENYISYAGIEEIKNGIFFSTKYESAQQLLNCPHIICFANFAPNVKAMSADRWNIVDCEPHPED